MSSKCGRYALLVSLVVSVPAHAVEGLAAIKEAGSIEFAAYADFPPFSQLRDGKPQGVDIDLGTALAAEIRVTASFRLVGADESVEDDLRNNVWKGHYLGGGVADAMLHVPTDPALIRRVEQVQVTAPYYRETVVVARDAARFSKDYTLEVFSREPIGVETASLADAYLLQAFGGRLGEQVRHYTNLQQATAALKAKEVPAVMGTLSEIENGLGTPRDGYLIGPMPTPGLDVTSWPLGVAVKAENSDLLAAIDAALQKLAVEGAIAAIFARHGLTYTPADTPAQSAQAE